MSQPTTSIGFSPSTPAAPTGNQNTIPQADGGTPLEKFSQYPQKATASLLGVVVPDGTTITVDGTGKISSVGTGMANPMTAKGDLIIGDTAGAPVRLAAGSSGQVLKSNGPGAALSWGTASGTSTHDEPLTDGDANFIFAATLSLGGDIIVVTGVPN